MKKKAGKGAPKKDKLNGSKILTFSLKKSLLSFSFFTAEKNLSTFEILPEASRPGVP